MLPPGLAKLAAKPSATKSPATAMIGIVRVRALRRAGRRFTENDNDPCVFFDERLRHLGKSLGVAVGKAEVEAQASALDIP